jgi:hypothetical protein
MFQKYRSLKVSPPISPLNPPFLETLKPIGSALEYGIWGARIMLHTPNQFCRPLQKFSSSPSEFSSSPSEFSSSPSEFSSSPSEFSSSPSEFSNSPSEFSNSPSEFSNSPSEFSNNPSEFSNSPSEFLNSPPPIVNYDRGTTQKRNLGGDRQFLCYFSSIF